MGGLFNSSSAILKLKHLLILWKGIIYQRNDIGFLMYLIFIIGTKNI